jgi:hypothetical protein
MASLIHNRPKQYRQRAEEARTKASAVTNEDRRKELLQIAETWERMADYEEKHAVLGGAFGPRRTPDGGRGNDPRAS